MFLNDLKKLAGIKIDEYKVIYDKNIIPNEIKKYLHNNHTITSSEKILLTNFNLDGNIINTFDKETRTKSTYIVIDLDGKIIDPIKYLKTINNRTYLFLNSNILVIMNIENKSSLLYYHPSNKFYYNLDK